MKIFQILILIFFVLTASTAAARADSNSLSQTVNNFSWKYLQNLDKDINIFYSPYSIAAAFSIVANGATGQTQKEILNALDAKNINDLNNNFEKFRDFIEKNYRDDTILKESDLILVNKDYIGKGIDSKFKKIVQEVYRSEIDSADFTGNSAAEMERIRNWVAENTNNFLPNYEASINPETIVNILDVIYFKGRWQYPFEASRTWKSDFTNKDGSKSKVQMMAQTFNRKIPYYADEKYMAVAMPYRDDFVAMYVILPVDENNLNVAYDWDAEDFSYRENFLTNLRNSPKFDGKVEVFIPKFELDINNDLNKELNAIGVQKAFSDDAEFFNIVKKVQLKISDATHQAKIKVDEEGTEAAAVTRIGMLLGAAPDFSKTIYFRADRPFLFVICDVQSGMNLFTGVVNSL